MHQWSSGKIVPCHGTDPGSIPGWCKLFALLSFLEEGTCLLLYLCFSECISNKQVHFFSFDIIHQENAVK